MTQTRSNSEKLSIRLTPMQISEAVPQAGLALSSSGGLASEVESSPSLVLHPGEASEMVVQVKNLGTHTSRLHLRVEGDFPAEWCISIPNKDLHKTATPNISTIAHSTTQGVFDSDENRYNYLSREVAPGAQMDAVLRFQVPATFFEEPPAVSSTKLDFPTQVSVHADPGTNREQIQHAEFSLHIRPRSNFMNFLPVLYREVDFIGRFIKIFEQAFEPVVQSFNAMWANLDPLTAPEALLPFLSHWVAWPLHYTWTVEKQRRLIRRAMELYRWRGTRRGLRLYLHLYTGLPLDEHIPHEAEKHISITEPFGQGFILGAAKLGEEAVLGGGRPYHFVVCLRPDGSQPIDEELVRRIIEQEKPAFSTYELLIENSSV